MPNEPFPTVGFVVSAVRPGPSDAPLDGADPGARTDVLLPIGTHVLVVREHYAGLTGRIVEPWTDGDRAGYLLKNDYPCMSDGGLMCSEAVVTHDIVRSMAAVLLEQTTVPARVHDRILVHTVGRRGHIGRILTVENATSYTATFGHEPFPQWLSRSEFVLLDRTADVGALPPPAPPAAIQVFLRGQVLTLEPGPLAGEELAAGDPVIVDVTERGLAISGRAPEQLGSVAAKVHKPLNARMSWVKTVVDREHHDYVVYNGLLAGQVREGDVVALDPTRSIILRSLP